ncbi:MAG TPA: hypothetical protein PK453_05670 [Leptospiraceae bacterium]|nr:hypothetical protein [Leptospiraceae bacterium]HNH07434.1 hypothetical protein [Leptospiraceae bacterium]HNN02374.1 hypothetical protein [Leptospiraceae bacterium]HNO26677.1 hypothetical protein [Leptospiraceae bacterium]
MIDMNTLETYDALKKVNFTEEQSRELVRFFGKTLEADPASKRDLSETELRLLKEIRELDVKLTEIPASSKRDLSETELRLQKEIEGIRLEIKELDIRGREADSRIIQTISDSKVEILKWVAGMLIANTGLIVALSKLLK